MPEPGPSAPEPDDVPDIVEMTAAAINNNDNHGVTWDKVRRSTADRYRRLARRVLNAVAPEIERQIRERVAADLLAVDPVEWALSGARAGHDAARIARGEVR